MKINRILLCAFAASAMCACQTEKMSGDAPAAQDYTVSFVAEIEGAGTPQAKAAVGLNAAGKLQTLWEDGDKVTVYSSGNNAEGASTNKVKYAFETALTSPASSAVFGYRGDDFVDGEMYLAIYPHNAESTRDANFANTRMAQVDVPANQKLVAGGVSKDAVVMLACSDNLQSMKFMNAVALVKFKVSDADIRSGSIISTGSAIAGRFRGDVILDDSGKPTATELVTYNAGQANAPTNVLNFSLDSDAALVPGTEYYVAVRPTVLENGFSVSLNGTFIKSYPISEFKRSVIYDLGTLTMPEVDEDRDQKTLVFDFTTAPAGWPTKDGWTGDSDAFNYTLDGVDYEFLCTDCTDGTSKRVFWNSNGYLVLNATGRYLGLPVIEGYRLVSVSVKHATSAKTRKVGIASSVVTSKETPPFQTGGELLNRTFAVGEDVVFNLSGTVSINRYYVYTGSGFGFSSLTLVYEEESGSSPIAQNMVRIGTYNLRYINSTDAQENQWEVRKERVAQSITENDFDVFAANECSEGIKLFLEDRFASEYSGRYFNPYSKTGGDDSDKVEYIGILYRKNEFSLSDWHYFWLASNVDASASRPAARNDESGDHTYYRGGCCGVLTKTSTGQKMFVVATHGCLSAEKRAEYASIYEQIEKKYNTKGYPAFLIGDMNARPSDQASETYRTYWSDTYRELTSDKISGPFATYNGFNLKLDLMTDSRRIDYIYYRGATPVSYVCNDKKYDGLYASDHLPIYSDMILACEP